MRLVNYLNERTKLDIDNLPQILEKCQPFITDLVKASSTLVFLWSGREGKPDFFQSKVRKDRTPRDTPTEIHNMVDDVFQEKFGVKPRSNSIFCLLDRTGSADYGDPYIILPIGKYKTIWSPKIEDMFNSLDAYMKNYDIGLKLGLKQWKNLKDEEKPNQELYDFIERLVNESYTDKPYMQHLNKINQPVEIMLMAEEYVAISEEYRRKVINTIEEKFK